jgi:serine/threonine protein phosphatase 1
MPVTLTYAVGDIHGCCTKLRNLMAHCVQHGGGNTLRFVFLGDYIDRGDASREVVSLLMKTQASSPELIACLRGNHEEMLIDAVASGDERHWISNGGTTTLTSYGVASAGAIPREHLDWIAALPLGIADDMRLFVHAGVMPGVPIDEQAKDDLLWIREPFLTDPRDHGLFIVHGHTPSSSGRPQLRANRLNLDTGAYFGGPLTAAVFDDTQAGPRAFITDGGDIFPAAALAVPNGA